VATQLDPKAIADSLAQLTFGWTTGPGVAPQALDLARAAIASSLIAGKTAAEIHTVRTQTNAQPPNDPKLSADLIQIASATPTKPLPTIAFVRSAYAATLSNPSGVPDWARRAQVVQSNQWPIPMTHILDACWPMVLTRYSLLICCRNPWRRFPRCYRR
jgi:hypothetical protein